MTVTDFVTEIVKNENRSALSKLMGFDGAGKYRKFPSLSNYSSGYENAGESNLLHF